MFFASFNPAEAEEGFKSLNFRVDRLRGQYCFNPAEAEEWFRRYGMLDNLGGTE